MPNTRTIQKAFVGGEVSPEMLGRVDDPRYLAGAAKMRNMVPTPHGPVLRRPGLQRVAAAYTGSTGDSTNVRTRLIPFRFNDEQAYALEFGATTADLGYLRFHQNGTPLRFEPEDAIPYRGPIPTYWIAPGNDFTVLAASSVIASTDINAATDTWTDAETLPFVTGDKVGIVAVGSGGSFPTVNGAALNNSDAYYVIKLSDTTFQLARTYADATAAPPVPIDVTAQGSGNVVVGLWDWFADGDRVRFTGTLPSGIALNTDYYVYRNAGIGWYVHTAQYSSIAFQAKTVTAATAWSSTGNPTIQRYYQVGELASSGGSYYTAKSDVLASGAFNATNWLVQPSDRTYTIKSPYTWDQLADIRFAQSNDILTLVHPQVSPRELRRYETFRWTFVTTTFGAPIAAPTGLAVTTEIGHYTAASYINLEPGKTYIRTVSDTPELAVGTTVLGLGLPTSWDTGNWVTSPLASNPQPYAIRLRRRDDSHMDSGTISVDNTNKTFTVPGFTMDLGTRFDPYVSAVAAGFPTSGFLSEYLGITPYVTVITGTTFKIANSLANALSNTPITPWVLTFTAGSGIYAKLRARPGSQAFGIIQQGSVEAYEHRYAVTAVNGEFAESTASTSVYAENNLSVNGAKNILSWTAVPGAIEYRIYKESAGIYGYLGKSVTTTFEDSFFAPDLGVTPPQYDTDFPSATGNPSSVAYFEQRKVFGGMSNEPQSVRMTRSGTETDMAYHIPVIDDDRIVFKVAAREANAIRHIVPMTRLLMFTASSEWMVGSVDNDVVTATNLMVRPQSFVGAGLAQPLVISSNVVFAAARGGHVREMGYQEAAGGYITGDLSLRASHLFDGQDIKDLAFAKAPWPIVYAVSTSGQLLGMVYIPEEKVAAWFTVDTDGAVEGACVLPEGSDDRLYVLVNRSGVRSIQRLAPMAWTAAKTATYLDDYSTFDNTVTNNTITVTGGTHWGPSDLLTMTTNSAFWSGSSDVGDEVVLTTSTGTEYRIAITEHVSTTVVKGYPKATLPASLRDVAQTSWAIARDTLTGIAHLDGRTVSALADGEIVTGLTVSGGSVTLPTPAVRVCIGVPYTSELHTLPMTAQIEALAQGRMKNVNKAWLRTHNSPPFEIGPLGGTLTSSDVGAKANALATGEVKVTLDPSWTDGGQVHIRQTSPLPLEVVGMTLEVSVGG